MTRSLYVLGAPGVGKSTLMANLLTDWQPGEYVPFHSTGFGYETLYDNGRTGVHLGKVRQDFSGTDALSMSALPGAVDWARTAPLPDVVLGEGARLGHLRFLLALHERSQLLVVHLTANPYEVDRRCANRGSAQNANWRKGATTRASNAFVQAAAAGMNAMSIDTTGASTAEVEDAVRVELELRAA